jgi:hypothetical protein
LASRGYSQKLVLEEMEKCDVLCANCHKKIHWELSKNLSEEELEAKRIRYAKISARMKGQENTKRYLCTDADGNEFITENGLSQFLQRKSSSF